MYLMVAVPRRNLNEGRSFWYLVADRESTYCLSLSDSFNHSILLRSCFLYIVHLIY